MLKTFFRPRQHPAQGASAEAPQSRARQQPVEAFEDRPKERQAAQASQSTWSRTHAKWSSKAGDREARQSNFQQRSADEGGHDSWAHWEPRRSHQRADNWAENPQHGAATTLRRGGGSRASRDRRSREAASGGYRFGEPEAVESLEELQKQLEEAAAEEQSLRERLRSLEHELAQKGGRDGEDWGHRKSQLRASIDGAAAAVQDLREQRNSILCGEDPKIREEQQTREEIKQFKASERYATEAELDVRIEELETLMFETNLQLKEERKLLGEIQGLIRLKGEVQDYRRREANLRSEAEIINERLQETATQLSAKAQELSRAEAELRHLEQEREEALARSPEAAERASVHHQLNEWLQWKHQLQGKIELKERALQRQRAEEEEARQREAEREEERKRRAEQQERLRELREEREKQHQEARERKKAAVLKSAQQGPGQGGSQGRAPKPSLDELPKEPPHFAELRLLEQTLAYCRKLLPKDDTSEKERKPVEYNNPEGSLVIMPKEDRPDEFLFAPPKPRRHEGKVRKRPPTSKMKKTRTEGKQVLLHTPLSLQLFAELQIVPPVNTCDVPPTVDEVEERLATRREEMAKWEEKRKELLRQRLALELEKARQAQEEKEQERLIRLDAALKRLEERQRDLEEEDEEEDEESCAEALRIALRSAENLGASVAQLASAQALLRRWTQSRAEAALRKSMERLQEAQAELARAPERVEEEAEPAPESSSSQRHEDCSRQLRMAVKELEECLRSAKQADVTSEHLEAARELLEASCSNAKQEGDSSNKDDAAEAEESAAEEDDETGEEVEAADDFVPAILNLGDDDEEELVFDLGMG